MTEVYELPQGKIAIENSDKKSSKGYLLLNPDKELEKHNRPVDEHLVQIEGSCIIKLFKGEEITDLKMNAGDALIIPANKFHIHSNLEESISITMWEFHGDITDIIQNIRKNNKRVL